MPLRQEEVWRYARHLMIPELDEAAHDRLKHARVLVVGVGGLGSPALFYLAAAGIGTLGLVDHDVVELSNLQRQILFGTADLGRPKVDVAADRLEALNPGVDVVRHPVLFAAANALELVADYDVVVTGVDNFPSRYLLNDACVLARKTLVEAGVLRFSGIALTIRGGETTCYRCLFPEAPESGTVPCGAEAGVFAPTVGIIGVVQAAEVIKVVTGIGEPLYDRLLLVHAASMRFDEVATQRDPQCPVCGEHPSITEPVEYEETSLRCRQCRAGARGRRPYWDAELLGRDCAED
jgi:adenylyltransferase/sulfurtransferase